MIAPDVAAFERLHAAAAGQLRVITLAPELPGATALIKAAVEAGVIAAVGHTDATADVTSAAVDAGASHATHLFNGMRPLHHREPGPVGALLDRDEVSCEVIADGVHLHDTAIRLVGPRVRPGAAGPDHRRDGGRRHAGWPLPARFDAGRRGRGSGAPRRRCRARWGCRCRAARAGRDRGLDRHHGRRRPARHRGRACRSPRWPPRPAPPRPACSASATAPAPCARAWTRTWWSATRSSGCAR